MSNRYISPNRNSKFKRIGRILKPTGLFLDRVIR